MAVPEPSEPARPQAQDDRVEPDPAHAQAGSAGGQADPPPSAPAPAPLPPAPPPPDRRPWAAWLHVAVDAARLPSDLTRRVLTALDQAAWSPAEVDVPRLEAALASLGRDHARLALVVALDLRAAATSSAHVLGQVVVATVALLAVLRREGGTGDPDGPLRWDDGAYEPLVPEAHPCHGALSLLRALARRREVPGAAARLASATAEDGLDGPRLRRRLASVEAYVDGLAPFRLDVDRDGCLTVAGRPIEVVRDRRGRRERLPVRVGSRPADVVLAAALDQRLPLWGADVVSRARVGLRRLGVSLSSEGRLTPSLTLTEAARAAAERVGAPAVRLRRRRSTVAGRRRPSTPASE